VQAITQGNVSAVLVEEVFINLVVVLHVGENLVLQTQECAFGKVSDFLNGTTALAK
jgi:hypothetical protein